MRNEKNMILSEAKNVAFQAGLEKTTFLASLPNVFVAPLHLLAKLQLHRWTAIEQFSAADMCYAHAAEFNR